METFLSKIKIVWTDRALRNRVLFVFGILIAFRFLAAVPIPGINTFQLSQFLSQSQLFGILNLFSGGGLSTLSLVMLGLGPYITASIVMQLSTIMSPRLKAMYHEEGEFGRKKFNRYSRFLTVGIAAVQAFGLLSVLAKQGVLLNTSPAAMALSVIVVIAGSMLAMWLGELISEFGIGNGVSVLIFAGIIASLPRHIGQLAFLFDPSQIFSYLGFALVVLAVVLAVVLVTEAERPIPITYAKQARGSQVYGGTSTYIPLRINQAGVMPIIFAISILSLPQLVGQFLQNLSNPALHAFGVSVSGWLGQGGIYALLYFVLVVVFTYFYTAITFEPHAMAENLHKNGGFIPGIRPGTATEEYVGRIATRTTFFGAVFLGIIAVLPMILRSVTGVQALAIGGTGVLIVVSVLIDIMKKLDAQISMREY